MVSYARQTVILNTISCARQHRRFNREWNEHSTVSNSLFGSAGQDVAICGHNASSITVHASSCLSLALSLHRGPDSWRAHWIRAAHPTLVILGHDTAAFVEWGAPLPTGTQSARLRPGLGGHAWNADQGERGQGVWQTEWGDWGERGMTGLAFGPPRSQQHLRGQRGFCSFVIDTHGPCVDKSIETTHQQQHSELSPLRWCWLVGYTVFPHFVSISIDPYTAVGSDTRGQLICYLEANYSLEV